MVLLIHPKIPNNFTGTTISAEAAKIWVFGVPFDSTTSYRTGTRKGPDAIREASQQTELYDINTGIDVDSDIGFYDLGDMEIAAGRSEETLERVSDNIENILKHGKMPLMLGGEHSITAGAIMGAARFFGDIKLISFDAHADLRDEYEGNRYNHACVMRRITDIIGRENLLEVGIRSATREEAESFRDRIVFRHECRDMEETKKKILEFAKDANLYVSFDIDALDVAGTGTPQPDGLSYAEMHEFVSQLDAAKKIIGMDLVEVSPVPGNNFTEALAAKLLFQTCAILRKKI
ncbi:MAG: agmatinase [Candidatus Aenigmarchaeota archaeon]|nr:agmatinase [Candidatus Aenigmarchaeota archaeon]